MPYFSSGNFLTLWRLHGCIAKITPGPAIRFCLAESEVTVSWPGIRDSGSRTDPAQRGASAARTCWGELPYWKLGARLLLLVLRCKTGSSSIERHRTSTTFDVDHLSSTDVCPDSGG